MPGKLRCGAIDLCSAEILQRVLNALKAIIATPSNRHRLQLRNRYYFNAPDGHLPSEPGWYIILGPEMSPLYVGTAENLNARLNSDNGSRDGFANPQRTSDPERNFIKAFLAAGIFPAVSVVAIPETELRERLGWTNPLSKLDRENLEKVINIFRALLCGGEQSARS